MHSCFLVFVRIMVALDSVCCWTWAGLVSYWLFFFVKLSWIE
jgi:hypothetical protein